MKEPIIVTKVGKFLRFTYKGAYVSVPIIDHEFTVETVDALEERIKDVTGEDGHPYVQAY